MSVVFTPLMRDFMPPLPPYRPIMVIPLSLHVHLSRVQPNLQHHHILLEAEAVTDWTACCGVGAGHKAQAMVTREGGYDCSSAIERS